MAPRCNLCKYLFERMNIESGRQLSVMDRLTDAVIRDPGDEVRIAALKRMLRILDTNRKEAVERYESHLFTHSEKGKGAGAESVPE